MSNATQPMLTPEQQAQAFQELLRTLGDSDIVHKNAVASAVWVGFDILMSMGDEINRMWGARMLSAPTLTYFVTRYFSFAYLVYNATIVLSKDLSPTMCSRWGIMLAASVQLMSLFVNGLLAVRVNAFFSGDRRVKWIVGLFWIAETVVELVLSTISGAESAEPQPFPAEIPSSGCLPAGGATPRMTIAAWVTNIVYSVLCFSLITYRFLSVYLRRNLTNELAQTFLRDGAMLFFMVCGANIVNLILLYALPKSLITLAGVPWLVAAFSIASYRTILDLRGAHRKGSGFSSEFEMSQRQSSTPMAFANGPGVRHRRRRGKDILDIDYESTGIALQTFQASSDASQTLRGSEDAY